MHILYRALTVDLNRLTFTTSLLLYISKYKTYLFGKYIIIGRILI